MTVKLNVPSTCSCASTTPPSIVRDSYLTPDQLAAYLDGAVTIGTLRNWRSDGRGPAFIRIGRDVRYRIDDVDAWLAQLSDE